MHEDRFPDLSEVAKLGGTAASPRRLARKRYEVDRYAQSDALTRCTTAPSRSRGKDQQGVIRLVTTYEVKGVRVAEVRVLRTVFGAALVLAGGASALPGEAGHHRPGPAAARNPVVLENRLPGTNSWLAGWEKNGEVEGYASQVSVEPGRQVQFHVSLDPSARYRIEVYRLGWYHGLGGRRYSCLPSCTSDEPGVPRPVPAFDPASGYLDAGWPVTDTLRVGRQWLSGYYLGVVRVTAGTDAGAAYRIPFIVKSPWWRHSAILVQASSNTWQAYNDWGGRSLYIPDMQGLVDNHVSFDRPYAVIPMSDGSEQRFELPLLRFLERNGYDVSYQADQDTDAHPASLLHHRLVIVAGHDEYWTQTQRDAFIAARDAGVNLAFMGANIGYWRIRYEDDRRTIIEYRRASRDPEGITDKFRRLNPPQPECQLEGVQFDDSSPDTSSIGSTHPLTVADASDPWFAGTGLQTGDTVPNLASGEWDHTVPGCTPPNTTILFHYVGPPANDDVTRYRAASGATVFAAGSLMFNFALDDTPQFDAEHGWQDASLQRFVRNAFNAMSRTRILGTRPAIQARR